MRRRLQHPEVVEKIAAEAARIRELVEQHGKGAVPRLVRQQAERDRETLQKLAAVVGEFG